jgi:hypothetical protein
MIRIQCNHELSAFLQNELSNLSLLFREKFVEK